MRLRTSWWWRTTRKRWVRLDNLLLLIWIQIQIYFRMFDVQNWLKLCYLSRRNFFTYFECCIFGKQLKLKVSILHMQCNVQLVLGFFTA
jgi:hypothetical protein